MSRFALAALLFLPAAATPAASSMDEIRKCVSANLPQSARIQTIEMTSWDRAGGQRTLKARLFAARDRDQPRLMARADSPRDLAGTALLVRDADPRSEMYIFLPGDKRVRRLNGATTGGKLWGTDFSYDEFRRVSNAFADGDLERVGAEIHQGREVHALVLRPVGEGEVYETIRVLVDAQTCVPLQADFAGAGRVRKRMSAPVAGLRKADDGGWYARDLMLEDLAEGTRTRMRVLGVAPAENLSAGYFNPTLFYSAH